MRTCWKHLDRWRVKAPELMGTRDGETCGSFKVKRNGVELRIIATDGHNGQADTGWEHVSVHAFDFVFGKMRTPKWEEMCFVKDLFWDAEEEAMELHPRRSDYVNCHPCVLHLWRPTAERIPLPPKVFV